MKLKATFTFFMILTTSLLFCQAIDIKFVGGDEWEKPHFYSITSDNKILVSNTLIDSTNSTGFYQITELDFDGNILNSYTFGNSQESIAYDVVQSSEGDIFFLGLNEEDFILELYKFDNHLNPIWNIPLKEDGLYGGSFVLYDDKLMIICTSYLGSFNLMLDFEGNILWENTISDSMIWYATNKGSKTESGDVLVSGFSVPYDSLNADGYLYKISEQGDILWESNVIDTFNSSFSSIVELENGELLVTGTRFDYSTFSYFATITKLDITGDVIFQKVVDNDNYLFGKDILVHNDLIFMLCTTSKNVQDIMLVILDIQGNEISRHNLGDNRNNQAEQIKLINNNQLLIIGVGVNTIPNVNVDMKFITISDIDSITETNDLSFTRFNNIYPNPVQRGTILSVEKEIIEGAIFNQLGNKVMEIKDSRIISTDNLIPGIYFLHGVSNNQEYMEGKFVIVE